VRPPFSLLLLQLRRQLPELSPSRAHQRHQRSSCLLVVLLRNHIIFNSPTVSISPARSFASCSLPRCLASFHVQLPRTQLSGGLAPL